MRIQNGLLVQSSELAKFGLTTGRFWEVKTLFSVAAKGAESGGKRRQIRRPSHSSSPFHT
jgi:hypothetical protein